jgi:hypothetical protein
VLQLLDVQIKMIIEAALVKHKGSRLRWSIICLAIAAALGWPGPARGR